MTEPENRPNNSLPTSHFTADTFKWEDYLFLLLRHWYWLALSVAIALCLATLKIMRTTPLYTRSAAMLIKVDDKSTSSKTSQEFENLGIVGTGTNITNEIITLKSPSLMKKVVKRLGLDVQMSMAEGLHSIPLYKQTPVSVQLPDAKNESECSFHMKLQRNSTVTLYGFSGVAHGQRVTAKLGETVKTPVGRVLVQATPYWKQCFTSEEITVTKSKLTSVGLAYTGRLNVSPINKESSILTLSLVDASQQRADDVLLVLMDVYNEEWLKDRNLAAVNTYEFITERLVALSQELGDVDKQISDVRSQSNLAFDDPSAKYFQKSEDNQQQIFALTNQLGVARYLRDYMDDQSKKSRLLPSNSGIRSQGIEQMITDYNTLLLDRNEALANSSMQNPDVQRMNLLLEEKRTVISQSIDNLIDQYNQQLRNWERTERQTQSDLANAPYKAKALLTISRQQKVKESLYLYLLQKREENELSKSYEVKNTRLIQEPSGTNIPSAPRRKFTLFIAMVIGIAIPMLILFVMEFTNHRVRGRKDLDDLNIPFLGEIPTMAGKKRWWQRAKKNVERKVYIQENCKDLINESFRILRTKLDYFISSINQGDSKVIMITSFNAGSGKSFISLNLAKVLALKGKRVLAIDMDLRHTSLSTIAKSPKIGITSYLGNQQDDYENLICKNAIGENADLLPVGIIPPNPTEVLLSERMQTLFNLLRPQYDYIILDCPPIDIVADTSIVKKYADISLFVVRAGLMDRRLLKDVEKLHNQNVYNHMALLLNGTDYISGRYGRYRYGYGYGYRYGYGYGYGHPYGYVQKS